MNATQIKKIRITCDKCNGRGVLSYHAHVDNGVCYPCNGTGKVWARKNDRKPTFEWNEFHAKRIQFIIDLQPSTLAKMTYDQKGAMDDYVFGMTCDNKCNWLYHYYVEVIRPAIISG
jgi:hypothetical protein